MYDVFDKPPLAELIHTGVKGMKWGHRKSNTKHDGKIKIKRGNKSVVIDTKEVVNGRTLTRDVLVGSGALLISKSFLFLF